MVAVAQGMSRRWAKCNTISRLGRERPFSMKLRCRADTAERTATSS
jgi:hypothetical protein